MGTFCAWNGFGRWIKKIQLPVQSSYTWSYHVYIIFFDLIESNEHCHHNEFVYHHWIRRSPGQLLPILQITSLVFSMWNPCSPRSCIFEEVQVITAGACMFWSPCVRAGLLWEYQFFPIPKERFQCAFRHWVVTDYALQCKNDGNLLPL